MFDSEWLRGYACALAAVKRMHNQDSIVRDVMLGDGVTLVEIVRSGAQAFDTEEILEALNYETERDAAARGAPVDELRAAIRESGIQ